MQWMATPHRSRTGAPPFPSPFPRGGPFLSTRFVSRLVCPAPLRHPIAGIQGILLECRRCCVRRGDEPSRLAPLSESRPLHPFVCCARPPAMWCSDTHLPPHLRVVERSLSLMLRHIQARLGTVLGKRALPAIGRMSGISLRSAPPECAATHPPASRMPER